MDLRVQQLPIGQTSDLRGWNNFCAQFLMLKQCRKHEVSSSHQDHLSFGLFSCYVSADGPTDTGGEPVNEYVVMCTGSDGFRMDASGPETQLLVPNVEPGQTYFVQVHACNSSGMGPPSEVCMIHTPPVAPGSPPPPALVGKPKATGVALKWGMWIA